MIKSNISKMNTPFYKIRKVLAYIIASLIIFLNISTAYCVEANASILDDLGLSYDDIRQIMAENGQILPDSATRLFVQNLGVTGFVLANRQDIESWLADKLRGYSTGGTSFGDENSTDSEILDNAAKYLVNNVSKSGNTFTYNDNSRNILKFIANEYANDSGFVYAYTANWGDSVTTYPNGVMYNYCKNAIQNNQDDYYIAVRCGVNKIWLGFIPKINESVFVSQGVYGDLITSKLYNRVSWNPIEQPAWPEGTKQLRIENVNGEIVQTESTDWSAVDGYSNYFSAANLLLNADTIITNNGNWGGIGGSGYFMSYSKQYCYLVYKNIESMKLATQGQQSYYQNSNWQNFISGSGNYTVDSSNSNNVTYGDVNNYINNYYGDNGNYPDPTQVQVYIDNNIVTPDPTPTPTPNPDDPGGGGGSDDDPTFDLGFLGTIGRLIGSLITGIGNLITGILEGIVNALTGILSFLTTLITDIADVMPHGIMDLFSAILGWLPQEWITVMSLGILSMVLIGVFKIFK